MSKVFTYANLLNGERVFLANPHISETDRDDSGYQYYDVYDDEYLENKIALLGMSVSGTVGSMWGFGGESDARKDLSRIMRLALPLMKLPISLEQLTKNRSGYFPVITLRSDGNILYDENSLVISLPAGETPEKFFKDTIFGGKMTDEGVRMALLTYGYLEALSGGFSDFRFLSIEVSDQIWPISPARVTKAYRSLVDEGYLEPTSGNTSSGFPSFTRIPAHVRHAIENPTFVDESRQVPAKEANSSNDVAYIPDQVLQKLLSSANTQGYHTGKLESLIREINGAVISGHAHSAHALIRSLLDHISPLFGYTSFGQVANNYKWSETDRKRVKELNTLFRFDADDSLHSHISRKDTSVDMHSIGLIRNTINSVLTEAVGRD